MTSLLTALAASSGSASSGSASSGPAARMPTAAPPTTSSPPSAAIAWTATTSATPAVDAVRRVPFQNVVFFDVISGERRVKRKRTRGLSIALLTVLVGTSVSAPAAEAHPNSSESPARVHATSTAGPPAAKANGTANMNGTASVQYDKASADAALAYWTPARMKAVTSKAVTSSPQKGAPLRLGAATATAASAPVHSNSIGTLFYHYPLNPFDPVNGLGVDVYCTGEVINTQAKNIIATAAHCILPHYDMSLGPLHIPFASMNIVPVFVPAYNDGNAPFGRWTVSHADYPEAFRGFNNQDYDFGVYTAYPDPAGGGRQLGDVVGMLSSPSTRFLIPACSWSMGPLADSTKGASETTLTSAWCGTTTSPASFPRLCSVRA